MLLPHQAANYNADGERTRLNYEAYKPGSDINIAIYGKNITFDILAKLHWLLEDESPMPYQFDVVDFAHSNHEELKEHIERMRKIIYEIKAEEIQTT